MTAKQVPVQSGRVTTEGDDLYYEVRGQENRLPLLMIAPGGGTGGTIRGSPIFSRMNTKSSPMTAAPMPAAR